MVSIRSTQQRGQVLRTARKQLGLTNPSWRWRRAAACASSSIWKQESLRYVWMETARKLQAAPKFAGRAVVERIMALIEQSAELTVQRRHSVRLIQPSTGLSENRTGYVLLLRTVYGRRQSVAEASLPGTAGKSEPEAKFFVTT